MASKRKSGGRAPLKIPSPPTRSGATALVIFVALLLLLILAGAYTVKSLFLQDKISLSPDENTGFFGIPLSYWYWIMGLGALLIVLLIVLIVVIIARRSEGFQKSAEIIAQAKALAVRAEQNGYDKEMIRAKFKERGWKEAEIAQVVS